MAPKRRTKSLHKLAELIIPPYTIVDVLKQQFVIEREITRGGFGRIYLGHTVSDGRLNDSASLVIKVEPHENGPLFTEINVYRRILRAEKIEKWMKDKNILHLGLPPLIGSGIFTYHSKKMRFLAIPKYGDSLESYRLEVNGKIGEAMAINIALQCAYCLYYVQDQDYVHSDVKADNLVFRSGGNFDQCVLIDFGLAFMARNNIEEPNKKREHNGTALFTSLDAHRGCSPSFRGDMEIVLYNFLYWIAGSLPWSNFKEDLPRIFEAKIKFSENVEKSLTEYPSIRNKNELCKLFEHVYELDYKQKVNYDFIIPVLKKMAVLSKPPSNSGKGKAVAVGNEVVRTRKRRAERQVEINPIKTRLRKVASTEAHKLDEVHEEDDKNNRIRRIVRQGATGDSKSLRNPKADSKNAKKGLNEPTVDTSTSAAAKLVPGLRNMKRIPVSVANAIVEKYSKKKLTS